MRLNDLLDHTPKRAEPKRGPSELIDGSIAWRCGTVRRMIEAMPTLLNRLVRAAGLAAALVLVGIALVLGWDWLKVVGPPRLYPTVSDHRASGGIPCQLLHGPGSAALRYARFSGRRLAVTVTSRYRGRWLLLCGSIVLGLVFAEAAAAVWLCWTPSSAGVATSISPDSAHSADEILIVVIGESSALGVPYDGWLSVGAIVGSELQKAIPSHRFRIEVLAEKGATLEAMHLKLAMFDRAARRDRHFLRT